MSRIRYILLIAGAMLLSVACQRRPMEDEYLRVYLDLNIEREIVNYEPAEDEPGLMRVAFFDAVTGEYLSHDFVAHTGGYIFAPYGDVDMVVYNLEAGETRVRNYYIWSQIEAYTNEISSQQRSLFTRYLQSRVNKLPSYDDIRLTPDHLFVASEMGIHIPRHITEEAFVITATASTVVESWTIEISGIGGIEWVGGVTMMLSGQVGENLIATNSRTPHSVTIFFDDVVMQRQQGVLTSRFETFGRELVAGEPALLSVLFKDSQGHPYMYNFDVSDQMVDNPEQRIVIKADINIPKPEVGGGFKPVVDDWKEFEYDIDI